MKKLYTNTIRLTDFWQISLYILIISICIGGCSSSSPIKPPTISNETIAEVATITVTISPTKEATMTSITTQTLSPSQTQSKNPSVTPSSTLTNHEKFEYLEEELENNLYCVFPCWFGISPGQSSMLDLKSNTSTLEIIASDIYFEPVRDGWYLGKVDIQYQFDNEFIDIWSSFLARSKDDEILRINIDSQAYSEKDDEIIWLYENDKYLHIFANYSISQLFFDLGQPNQIFISAQIRFPGVDGELSPRDTFEIRVLYPETGIFAKFIMPIEDLDRNYRFCPANSFVELDLLPPNQENYQEILRSTSNWNDFLSPSQYNKTLEDALNISVVEFYDHFTTSANPCFETAKAIWPEH